MLALLKPYDGNDFPQEHKANFVCSEPVQLLWKFCKVSGKKAGIKVEDLRISLRPSKFVQII